MGKRVILVSQYGHLGGMTSSGLGWTDLGNPAILGGLGMDYQFLNDIFKISVEAFDFGRYDDNPQMRLYGNIQIYKSFLLTLGANDLITKHGNQDFFVGAGVYFTDNDFKSLFSSVSVP